MHANSNIFPIFLHFYIQCTLLYSATFVLSSLASSPVCMCAPAGEGAYVIEVACNNIRWAWLLSRKPTLRYDATGRELFEEPHGHDVKYGTRCCRMEMCFSWEWGEQTYYTGLSSSPVSMKCTQCRGIVSNQLIEGGWIYEKYRERLSGVLANK